MTTHDLDRLNVIADKVLQDNITVNELKEFNELLTLWDEVTEHTLLDYHQSQQVLSK